MFQRFQRGRCGRICFGFKADVRVDDAVGGAVQIILQGACQLPGLRIRRAKGQIVVLITHTDRSVFLQPARLVGSQERVCACADQMLFNHLMVIVPVFFLDPVHAAFQVSQQIRPCLVHGKIEVGRPDLAHRKRTCVLVICIRGKGVDRDIGVQLPFFQHLQRFFLGAGYLDNLALDIVALFPFTVKLCLDAALVHADLFPVQRGKIR